MYTLALQGDTLDHCTNYVSPISPTRLGGGEYIIFGSVVVVVCVVVCVIPCERNNFLILLNLTYKLEPCIDHIKA